jgi:hypothetical protein
VARGALLLIAALLVPAWAAPAWGKDEPRSWDSVEKLVKQSTLIAIITIKAADEDEHTMKISVEKVLYSKHKSPRKFVMSYYSGDDLPSRVPVGSRALAFLIYAKKRGWTPAFADGYGIWSIQDDEVIEWLEGKKQGYFYTLKEVSRRVQAISHADD